MKTITLLNEKGGVGKTTLATHIAVGLAIRGQRVVLVDADPQANATTALGVNKQPAFHDLVVRHLGWRNALHFCNPADFDYVDIKGRLMLVPGNVESRVVPLQISNDTLIRQRFAELEKVVDYIIVDTSPTPSLLHSSIVLASDYVIAPTDCEAWSALDGLVQTIIHTNEIHEQAAQHGISLATFAGIIPNKYRSGTVAHSEVLMHLHRKYETLVWPPVPLATAFAQSQLGRKFLYQVAPYAPITNVMWDIVDRVEVLA